MHPLIHNPPPSLSVHNECTSRQIPGGAYLLSMCGWPLAPSTAFDRSCFSSYWGVTPGEEGGGLVTNNSTTRQVVLVYMAPIVADSRV